MEPFAVELNRLVVDAFRYILKVEEQAVKKMGNDDLTINELHLIEAVGRDKEKGRTISEIAQELNITLSSVTIAINKLLKKKYVKKMRCTNDGRVVYVSLTEAGRKTDIAHRYFHRQIVNALSAGFNRQEKEILLSGIEKLNGFLLQKLAELEG